MIKCIGTIETPAGVYVDPVINAYFLSYSAVFGILAIPQIMDGTAPIDQLLPTQISGPGSETVNRVDVENAMIMYLSNEFPNCIFTKIV